MCEIFTASDVQTMQATLNFKCWKIIEKPSHYAIFFSQCDYKSAKSRNKFRELKKMLNNDRVGTAFKYTLLY